MTIEKYVEPVFFKEYEEVKDLPLKDIVFMYNEKKLDSFYITENFFPIYVFENFDILNIVLSGDLDKKLEEYLKQIEPKIYTINYDTDIIDAYYFMRTNNLKSAAVIKDNKLIGKVLFKIISARLSDIVIRDPLTGLFNEKFFEILVDEYKDIHKPIGLIFIDIKNIGIIEGLYGPDKVKKILIAVAEKIKKIVRDVDFVFRNEARFKIITFNSLEITKKIAERIRKAFENFEVDGINVLIALAYAHTPEMCENIYLAISEIENRLID